MLIAVLVPPKSKSQTALGTSELNIYSSTAPYRPRYKTSDLLFSTPLLETAPSNNDFWKLNSSLDGALTKTSVENKRSELQILKFCIKTDLDRSRAAQAIRLGNHQLMFWKQTALFCFGRYGVVHRSNHRSVIIIVLILGKTCLSKVNKTKQFGMGR